MNSEPLPKAYRRASVSLFRTAGFMQALIETRLAPLGISTQQLRALTILAEQPEQRATVSTIRESMMDPMSNVSRLLNKLMQKGLVEKRRDEDDQRVVHIRLRPEGLALMQAGQDALSVGESNWGRLSRKEAKTLTELLDRLRD